MHALELAAVWRPSVMAPQHTGAKPLLGLHWLAVPLQLDVLMQPDKYSVRICIA
jgi:hypothetical protein